MAPWGFYIQSTYAALRLYRHTQNVCVAIHLYINVTGIRGPVTGTRSEACGTILMVLIRNRHSNICFRSRQLVSTENTIGPSILKMEHSRNECLSTPYNQYIHVLVTFNSGVRSVVGITEAGMTLHRWTISLHALSITISNKVEGRTQAVDRHISGQTYTFNFYFVLSFLCLTF